MIGGSRKESTFEQELATPGCDPRASVSVKRRGKIAKLVANVSAARGGPGVTGITVRLPKTLRRGKRGAVVITGGHKFQPLRTGKRRVTFPFAGDGVRKAKVVWRGLRASRKLRRMTLIGVSLKDARDHTATFKKHVRVRGKRR